LALTGPKRHQERHTDFGRCHRAESGDVLIVPDDLGTVSLV
jgi:hypothetical protein